ncbi:uncharacterized protein A4U43_C03F19990 [Asparagus officinalis]|uniref:D-2-hydroxyglutarate dehydrogenase n=1 Tax=Asparagus officinalis TaxID=4686 RepID=A0A5P1FBK7_ASPOF|nr:uncharacterized protein A4U43_C03F19990 [Asparagus officinalis]
MQRLRRTSQLLLRCRSSASGLFYGHQRTPYDSIKRPYWENNHLAFYYTTSNHMGAVQASVNVGLHTSHKIPRRSFSSASTSIQRSPLFSTLNSDDVSYFKEILGDKTVIQEEDRLLAANVDWMGKYKGSSQLLLLPKSTEEVSKILQYCNSRRLAVVPQGGNTGLVGGSVPVYDEVIINVGSMDKIISLDKVSGILICEAGCILDNLNTFLANEGFVMPLDLGAKGSCQIGGNISTNAGGLHFIRYGSLHGNILGLEVVLADGTILDMLTTLRKDNTGYDLKHLFIGSEGTLGIVTKVSILTPPKLVSTNVAFLACEDFTSCQVLGHVEGVRNPLPPSLHNFYVLIETTGSDESYDKCITPVSFIQI